MQKVLFTIPEKFPSDAARLFGVRPSTFAFDVSHLLNSIRQSANELSRFVKVSQPMAQEYADLLHIARDIEDMCSKNQGVITWGSPTNHTLEHAKVSLIYSSVSVLIYQLDFEEVHCFQCQTEYKPEACHVSSWRSGGYCGKKIECEQGHVLHAKEMAHFMIQPE